MLTGIIFSLQTYSQLIITTGSTPAQMVQNTLLGPGISVSNVTFVGSTSSPYQIGEFSNGNTTNLGMDQGIVMSSGDVTQIPGPVTNFASTSVGTAGIPEIDNIAGGTSYDGAKLEFDFIPLDNIIQFQYVFGSEEYPEYVNSSYNDAFAFLITGPNPSGGNYTDQNIALIPFTTTPVTINNVNSGSNSAYYIDNQALNGQTIVLDGFTTVLIAQADVTACQSYHIKFAIADIDDSVFDSDVFLKANSFSTDALDIVITYSNGTSALEGCSTATVTATVGNAPAAPLVVNYTISGTSTNGTDFATIPSSITIPAGNTSASFTILSINCWIPGKRW